MPVTDHTGPESFCADSSSVAEIAQEANTRRYGVLDTYRFIAAIGVVLYHCEKQFGPELGDTNIFDRFHLMVDFFFVLSGFVLMHTYGLSIRSLGDFGYFLRKRLARIYPLHLVTTLAFVALAIFVHHFNINVNNPRILDVSLTLPHLLLLHAWGATDHIGLDYPSWSISAEFFVYLLFPVFAIIIYRIGALRSFALAAVFAVTMMALRSQFGLQSFLHATYDFGNFRAVPSFTAGMAAALLVNAMAQHPAMSSVLNQGRLWHIANGFAAITLVCMLMQVPEEIIFLLFPVPVILIALADRSGDQTILSRPAFVRLGECSYSIYLLHPFIAIAVAVILRKLGWTQLPFLITGGLMEIALSIGTALLSFSLLEKPMRRLMIEGSFRPKKRSATGP